GGWRGPGTPGSPGRDRALDHPTPLRRSMPRTTKLCYQQYRNSPRRPIASFRDPMTDRPDPDLTASRSRKSLDPEASVVAELSGTGALLLATDRRVLVVWDPAACRPARGV